MLITGNDGTIAGRADIWWSGHWKYGRPHALLFSRCQRVVVSNITVKDSPFWSIRFWASRQVRATNLIITANRHVYNNDGIDVDSTSDAVLENVRYVEHFLHHPPSLSLLFPYRARAPSLSSSPALPLLFSSPSLC